MNSVSPIKTDALARLVALLAVCFPLILNVTAGESETSKVKEKAIAPELAMQQFKVPQGFKVDLFASEPQMQNPVAFCFDENGRIYLAETYRLVTSVYDVRSHMDMYSNDLASRTVEDRGAMVKKFLGPNEKDLAVADDDVRLLEDTTGAGTADRSTIFAGGFNGELEGLGAGVLARKGDVFYTDIPNLWRLRDPNHTGHATERTSLSYGYGVHYNYAGHDLHGLCIGPDGRLYFSIGDRGLHVTTKEGKLLDYPDTGSVLRCNLDGSGLEVFSFGVRNPQDLAFDDHGNLFTGDNNCDYGDSARLVYLVEGGDSGWRTPYQFGVRSPAGPWNAEKLWYLQFPEQAAYLVPPAGHIASGPSGIAHYPGTGFPDSFRDHFFLSDFRGSANGSGIHSFALKENSAGFELTDHTQFFWNILATDVKFSPDGRMFVADWVQGWDAIGLGRLYRLYDPERVNSKLVRDTKSLIAEGMEKRPPEELESLLAHPDQRVRQEAQFEIVDRALDHDSTPAVSQQYNDILLRVAQKNDNPLARLHGVWGLGQIGRTTPAALGPILPLLEDNDPEVAAQTAKVIGDARFAGAANALIKALGRSNSRVRFFSAISLGILGDKDAVGPLLTILRENADKDTYLRHAGVMGLTGCADPAALLAAASDSSRSVRMGVLLAMRRLKLADISVFLHDSDPLIVLEAARAINDVPINDAMPQLASLIEHPSKSEPLDERVINANFRDGSEKNAAALAGYAALSDASETMRSEALFALETWAAPDARDRVTGFWRPLADRDAKVASRALDPVFSKIIASAPDAVRLTAIEAAQKLSMTSVAPALLELAANTNVAAKNRVASLEALGDFHDPRIQDAVESAMTDRDETVREEATRLLALINPGESVKVMSHLLETGTLPEKQSALAILGGLKSEASDVLLADWLDDLIAGKAPREIQLDLLQAASKHDSDSIKEKLKHYESSQPADDEFLGYRETLYGGNVEAGKKIFMDRPEAGCFRCHKISGKGGDVGPDLAGIITRHDRNYILESILFPNKQIAPGFESLIVQMDDGRSYAGVVKGQTDDELSLMTSEENENVLVELKKSGIKKKVKGLSAMPEGLGKILSKKEIRDVVEFLATVK